MKLYVLVENFQGVNHGVRLFISENDALDSYEKYVGYKYGEIFKSHKNLDKFIDYEETKIFEVEIFLLDNSGQVM